MARVAYADRLTFDMPPEMRAHLDRMAADRGWSVAQCLRHIIAAHFTRLQEEAAS